MYLRVEGNKSLWWHTWEKRFLLPRPFLVPRGSLATHKPQCCANRRHLLAQDSKTHSFYYKMYSNYESKVRPKADDLSHRNTASDRATATSNFLHALTAPFRAALCEADDCYTGHSTAAT